MRRRLSFLAAIFLLLLNSSPAAEAGFMGSRLAPESIQKPVQKWANGGCFEHFCTETSYSSPAAADLDGDGTVEVIAASSRVMALDGASGAVKWRVPAGYDRSQPDAAFVGGTWADVVIADIDRDTRPEILTSHSNGSLSVYNPNGYFKPGWPRQVTPGFGLRSLGVYDLDGSGNLEILTASTREWDQWFVFQPDGTLQPGQWPQFRSDADTTGTASGCYNQNIAAGDLDGDLRAEILGPSDIYTVSAFNDVGSQIRSNAKFGRTPNGNLKFWSQVPFNVDETADIRGYTECATERRASFSFSSPVIVDVNGDGKLEGVVIGDINICGTGGAGIPLYHVPYIVNGDRTRWKADGFDWTVLPKPGADAAPLSTDYHKIDSVHPNITPVDLDGDGRLEILYPSYDGRVHAYWLDGKEHGSWPFVVKKPADAFISFATESVVADLNADGQPEVIFASWTQKGSHQNGKLYVLNSQGSLLWEIPLPAPVGGEDWNGALAAPTLANIDADADLELLINSVYSGVIAYDLPGSANARVFWETGHGSPLRSGSPGSLAGSAIQASRANPKPGDVIGYAIALRNPGPALKSVTLSNALPEGLSFYTSPTASTGQINASGNKLIWSGEVNTVFPVTIQYQVRVDDDNVQPRALTNKAVLTAGSATWTLQSTIIINGRPAFLPVTQKQ